MPASAERSKAPSARPQVVQLSPAAYALFLAHRATLEANLYSIRLLKAIVGDEGPFEGVRDPEPRDIGDNFARVLDLKVILATGGEESDANKGHEEEKPEDTEDSNRPDGGENVDDSALTDPQETGICPSGVATVLISDDSDSDSEDDIYQVSQEIPSEGAVRLAGHPHEMTCSEARAILQAFREKNERGVGTSTAVAETLESTAAAETLEVPKKTKRKKNKKQRVAAAKRAKMPNSA